jgi:hypothetical protein
VDISPQGTNPPASTAVADPFSALEARWRACCSFRLSAELGARELRLPRFMQTGSASARNLGPTFAQECR